jgi:hypothetical protein
MATDGEIIKKHSLNPNSAVEQMDCSLDTLMGEARAEGYKQGQNAERKRCIEIVKNMLWKKELDHQKDGLVMKINEADLMVTNDEDDEYDEYENDENLNEQIITCAACKTRAGWKEIIYDKFGSNLYFTCEYGHKNVLRL